MNTLLSADQVWARASKQLCDVLHPDIYSRWIAVIHAGALRDGAIELVVDNDFYQTWLEENYLSLIRDAVAAAAGQPLNVVLRVAAPQGAMGPPPEEPARKKTIRDRFSRAVRPAPMLNARFTFDSFIVGPSNSFPHAASMAVAQAPARAYNPLFIYGDVGLGKTHLMQAIGHHVLAASRATVCYISSEALMNEYISALQANSLVQFRKKYRSTDLLLVDDIHFLANKERLQEEFFHTFNTLFDAHKQIVMTSDRPASEITGLEQRLVSRFEWGLVAELEPPDLETRIAILRHKAAQTRLTVPDEFVLFIAENVRSNIRRLEGALVRLASYASLTGRELSLDSLKHLLRDTLDQEKRSEVSLDTIQKAVAEHYDIRIADMSSKRRPREIAGPRQVAMYLCRRMTRSSLPDIANAFGKTHATVLHACKAVESRMDVDADLKCDVSSISQKLGKAVH